jgi:hypothetical protein
MGRRATAGARLSSLVKLAIPLYQQAERDCPRTGPGCKPEIPDWVLAVLIMVVTIKRKKSKSAQYRYLNAHRVELREWLGTAKFPARSTYFDRYQRAEVIYTRAIELQGHAAIAEGIAVPREVAIDKTMIPARGPKWHAKDRKRKRIPPKLRGVDRDSDWGYSKHDGWVQGYSLEVAVTATKGSVVFPLLASVSTANARETQTVLDKIPKLPAETKHVLADSGYDSNDVGELVEWTSDGRRTGRRFLCPENKRGSKSKSTDVIVPRDEAHRRRLQRREYYRSSRGKLRYARRGQAIEPFNEWFKSLFELEQQVHQRGLRNNKTQMLAALFCYQLLVRYNHRCGNHDGQIRGLLDIM